jgi:hypothetical protein
LLLLSIVAGKKAYSTIKFICRVTLIVEVEPHHINFLLLVSDVTGLTHHANTNGKVTELSSLVNKMLLVFEPVCASLKENWANIALQVHESMNLHTRHSQVFFCVKTGSGLRTRPT